jgi:hypothetical protein
MNNLNGIVLSECARIGCYDQVALLQIQYFALQLDLSGDDALDDAGASSRQLWPARVLAST